LDICRDLRILGLFSNSRIAGKKNTLYSLFTKKSKKEHLVFFFIRRVRFKNTPAAKRVRKNLGNSPFPRFLSVVKMLRIFLNASGDPAFEEGMLCIPFHTLAAEAS